MHQDVVDVVVDGLEATAAFVRDIVWRVAEHEEAEEL